MSNLSNEFNQHLSAMAARPMVDCCISALDDLHSLGLMNEEEMEDMRMEYRISSDEALWSQYWMIREWIERAETNRRIKRERQATPRRLLAAFLAITALCITWNISANVNQPAAHETVRVR